MDGKKLNKKHFCPLADRSGFVQSVARIGLSITYGPAAA